MASAIQDSVKSAMKEAMRAKAEGKAKLAVIRLIQAEFKRIEVDERIELDDTRVIAVLDKMCKQRRDSVTQYQEAGREELAAQEEFEITIIQEFLPAQLTEAEIADLIDKAIEASGAAGMQDMGKVMGILKPQMQGRANMGEVSKLIKSRLA